jgi:hypothetical protein
MQSQFPRSSKYHIGKRKMYEAVRMNFGFKQDLLH